jgi:hypothetical protein
VDPFSTQLNNDGTILTHSAIGSTNNYYTRSGSTFTFSTNTTPSYATATTIFSRDGAYAIVKRHTLLDVDHGTHTVTGTTINAGTSGTSTEAPNATTSYNIVDWHPNSSVVAMYDYNKPIKIYTRSGTTLSLNSTITGSENHSFPRFSGSGRYLIANGPTTLKVYETASSITTILNKSPEIIETNME